MDQKQRIDKALATLDGLGPFAEDARAGLRAVLEDAIAGTSDSQAPRVLEAARAALESDLASLKPLRRNSLGRVRGIMVWLEPLQLEAFALGKKTATAGACLRVDAERADAIDRLLDERFAELRVRDSDAADAVASIFSAAAASCDAARTCGSQIGPTELLIGGFQVVPQETRS